jgi:AraC family transcriptional regulator
MNPVGKELWYIESHFAQEITLEDIAAIGGVSRFHMSRAFGYAAGRSVMSYVRGRRLSEAARSLADGAPDILAIALDASYGSHEAFTRAFRDQFGLTPEAVRATARNSTRAPERAGWRSGSRSRGEGIP